MFSKNVLKVVPIHVYKFSFLIPRVHTEFLVIIFDRAKNRSSTLVWETRGDCCLKSLKEEQIILYSQHLPKKNFSLIASRKEKKYMKCVKMTFSCGNYNIFTFFSCCLHETRTKDHQGPSKTVAFFRTPSKIFMSGTWNFRIIERNIKAIFREYFSSLREDSGKIFKLMTFRRGPRTTYCILWRGTCTMFGVGIFYYQQVLC